MITSPFIYPLNPVLNKLGLFAGDAQVYFYLTGTTTLATIYDDTGTALANPVTADAFGRLPNVYLDDSIVYRIRAFDILGVLLGDIDPYQPVRGALTLSDIITSTFTPTVLLGTANQTASLEFANGWVQTFANKAKLQVSVTARDMSTPNGALVISGLPFSAAAGIFPQSIAVLYATGLPAGVTASVVEDVIAFSKSDGSALLYSDMDPSGAWAVRLDGDITIVLDALA